MRPSLPSDPWPVFLKKKGQKYSVYTSYSWAILEFLVLLMTSGRGLSSGVGARFVAVSFLDLGVEFFSGPEWCW